MVKKTSISFASASGPRALDVMVAASALARMRGLLWRPALGPGQGMLLRPCNLVHTIGMRYPIDVVFLRRDGTVLRVAPEVGPRRMRGHWSAACVLELAAGEAARCGLAPGLKLPLARC